MQDYQQNRKTATTGGFGPGAFGSTTQPATTGGLFGQTQATTQPTQSTFGGGTGAFGTTGATPGTGFGAFGQQQQQPQQPQQPQQQQQTGTGFGAFGQTQPQQSTGFGAGGFGTTQPQQQQQQQQPQQTGGLFAAGNSAFGQKPAAGGFGTSLSFRSCSCANTSKVLQPQVPVLLVPEPEPLVRPNPRPPLPSVLPPSNPRQAHLAQGDSAPVSLKTRLLPLTLTLSPIAANKTIFGQPTTGAFGSNTTGTGTGIFGQQPQQQQPAQPATGLFGATTTGTTGTGLFGQQQQPQPTGREHTNSLLSGRISLPPSLRYYPAATTTAATDRRSVRGADDRSVRGRTTESTRSAESTGWQYIWSKDYHARHRTLWIYYYLYESWSGGDIVWGWYPGTTAKPTGYYRFWRKLVWKASDG